jgi:hypothetical protein
LRRPRAGGFRPTFPEHPWKEIVQVGILVFREEERLRRRPAELLQIVDAEQAPPGVVPMEWYEIPSAHADERRAVFRQQSKKRRVPVLHDCRGSKYYFVYCQA